MRDLLASALIMAALIGTWLVFDGYSQDELAGFSAVISAEIIPAVEEESWDESLAPVSYTHLDVYKRQAPLPCIAAS